MREPEFRAPRGARAIRWAYLVAGWICVALGVIGAVLPVVPTTPFMLVAVWAFSKSSDRFHAWLYHHPVFGPPLMRWQRHRVIPPVAKLGAVGGMVASLVYLALFTAVGLVWLVAAGVVMAVAAGYIVTRPGRVPAGED